MRIKVSGKTDIGRRRSINQDFLLMDSKNGLFIVADGMGGHKGGEVASRLATQTLQREVLEHLEAEGPNFSPMEALRSGFQEATRVVYLEANKPGDDSLQGMGTTMVAAFVYQQRIYLANVGDSRAYLFRQGNLWRMTEDHSLVNEQLRSGIILEEDLETVKGKNVITRSVGFAPEVSVDLFFRDLVVGEKFLLCSDGLYGMIPDRWIQDFLTKGPLDNFVEESVVEANNRGGDDNLTCLLIEVEP